jgi:hypothetical protein
MYLFSHIDSSLPDWTAEDNRNKHDSKKESQAAVDFTNVYSRAKRITNDTACGNYFACKKSKINQAWMIYSSDSNC